MFNTSQKVSLTFFLLLVVFWVTLAVTKTTEGIYNYTFSFLFGLIPLVGGIIAMFTSRMWGGLKTALGKAIFFIGFGVFLWGCGETIWSYYNFFLGIAAPYPSLADLGFAPSIFFYGLGTFYLSKVTGAKYGLRSKAAKFFVTLAPLIILILSYYILIVVARGGILIPEGDGILKILLDLIYPLGDFVGLTIGVIISGLSFQYLGGHYKVDILAILLGLGVMYIADSVFSYTTTVGTYYNADFGDLLLMIGTFLLTFGVLGFSKIKESHESTQ